MIASVNNMTGHRVRFDVITRSLHALLAISVVTQLSLSAVMRVPSGPGAGTFDWHREAFEIHARLGLWVAAICALHWVWSISPRARPGAAYLFPWLRRAGRLGLATDARAMMRLERNSSVVPNRAVATIHGLGLLAVTGQATAGVVTYFVYWLGYNIPKIALHYVERFHVVMGFVFWAFVCGHLLMALLHYLTGDREIAAIFTGSASSPESLARSPAEG